MLAIITEPRDDGTYDDVGTNHRIMQSKYKSIRTLLRYGVPDHFKGTLRVETWPSIHSFYTDEKPSWTFYAHKEHWYPRR
jgi:hypothetical protein